MCVPPPDPQLRLFRRTQWRPAIEDYLAENYRYRTEALHFLYQEVEYGERLSELALKHKPDSVFRRNTDLRIKALRDALNSLAYHMEAVFKGYLDFGVPFYQWENRAFLAYLGAVDQSIATLGQVIQATASSLIFRRFRGASALVQAPPQNSHPSMRLSEVHLDYPDTVRGISGLVDHYFTTIQRELLPEGRFLKMAPPIVQIAQGRSFSFEYFCDLRLTPIVIHRSFSADPESKDPGYDPRPDLIWRDETRYIRRLIQRTGPIQRRSREAGVGGFLGAGRGNKTTREDNELPLLPEELRVYAKYLIQFSRIVAPRYFPVMIRYAPVLLHELMHPILAISEIVGQQVQDLCEGAPYGKVRIYAKQSDKEFGAPLRVLHNHVIAVQNSLHRVLVALAKDSAKKTRQWSTRKLLTSWNRSKVARAVSVELLADLGALTAGKISYLGALLFHGYTDNELFYLSNLSIAELKHPPPIVRYRALLEIARKMGFDLSADKLETLLQNYLRSSEHEFAINNMWEIWRKHWWSRVSETLVPEIIAFFDDCFAPTSIERYCKESPEDGTGLIPRYDEKRLHSIYDIFLGWIDKNRLIWDDPERLHRKLVKLADKENWKKHGLKDVVLERADVMNILWKHLLFDSDREGRQRLQWRLALANSFKELR